MRYLVKLMLLLLPLGLGAQTVTITGTVQDGSGIPYQNGTVRAVLVSGNGSGQQAWTFGGTNPVTSPQCIGGLDGFGKFTCPVTNTSLIDQQTALPQWQFQFNSFNYPVGGTRSCTVPSLSLSSNQDITTQIAAVPCPSLTSATGNLSSPPPIGNVTPNTGSFTTLAFTKLSGTAVAPGYGAYTLGPLTPASPFLPSWSVAQFRQYVADATPDNGQYNLTSYLLMQPSGSTANFQKVAVFGWSRNADTTATAGSRDAVGIMGYGSIAAGNTTGRAYGGNTVCSVELAANGLCTGLEIDMQNVGAVENNVDALDAKNALYIVPNVGGSYNASSGGIVFAPVANSMVTGIYLRGIVSGGFPIRYTQTGSTTCSVVGGGTGAICTLETASTDLWGTAFINTGTTPASNGSLTLTFSQTLGINTPSCVFNLAGGTSQWSTTATTTISSRTNTAYTVTWNNGGALTGSSTYAVTYICMAK